jgi:transposase
VIAKKIPQALNILDLFHTKKNFGEVIDEVRRKETERLVQDGYEPVLKKSRWLLLKRQEKFTFAQRGRLKTLLSYNIKTVKAYLLREYFQHFWTYSSVIWVRKFLHEWIGRTMRSRIEPIKKFARMLKKHEDLIINWFVAQGKLSSGIVEAMNNTDKSDYQKIIWLSSIRNFEICLIPQAW